MNIVTSTTRYEGLSHDQRYNYYNDSDTNGATVANRGIMKMLEVGELPDADKLRKALGSSLFADLVARHDGHELKREVPNRKPRLYCVMKAEDFMAMHRAEFPTVDIEYERRRNRWLSSKKRKQS